MLSERSDWFGRAAGRGRALTRGEHVWFEGVLYDQIGSPRLSAEGALPPGSLRSAAPPAVRGEVDEQVPVEREGRHKADPEYKLGSAHGRVLVFVGGDARGHRVTSGKGPTWAWGARRPYSPERIQLLNGRSIGIPEYSRLLPDRTLRG